MKSLMSESNPFQSLPKIKIFGLARREERLSCSKLKQAFLIIDSVVELFHVVKLRWLDWIFRG